MAAARETMAKIDIDPETDQLIGQSQGAVEIIPSAFLILESDAPALNITECTESLRLNSFDDENVLES